MVISLDQPPSSLAPPSGDAAPAEVRAPALTDPVPTEPDVSPREFPEDGAASGKAVDARNAGEIQDPASPPDTDSGPDGTTTPAAGTLTSAPTRITVTAAGIDVPVLQLSPTADDLANQSIVPPYTDDGYWISSYGSPGAGSTDTTYITGHSWEGREAPFDRFSTHASVGDAVTITTGQEAIPYVIDSITTHDKDTLRESDIWAVMPNRLVIISCYTEDPWGKNVVITASPQT
ncbi:class F sortase [Arthrobacter sp. NamB2]|uniref:class F sortase n=1 Tax=Arthrobacter sp. NamB2 TaxID=2576035 RepID=UPI0010C9A6F2|nr:class F sortase [Arthrobacter sp. NamB2]TKV27819.1 class F sortase [Arthrobacter sp. NamB2]